MYCVYENLLPKASSQGESVYPSQSKKWNNKIQQINTSLSHA